MRSSAYLQGEACQVIQLATLNEAVKLGWLTEASADRAVKEIDKALGSDRIIIMLRWEYWGEYYEEICVMPYAMAETPTDAITRWGLIQ